MYSNINTDIYSNYCNYLFSLEKLPWKIIGTLTFRDKSKKFNTQRSNKLREEDFLRLLDNTAFKLKFDKEKVPWFLRHESSIAQRWHIHFIISDCRALKNIHATTICEEMISGWTRDFRGPRGSNGTCVITPYDPNKDGLKYICKLSYEEKFHPNPLVENFILSDSLKALFNEADLSDPGVITCRDERYSKNIQRSDFGDPEDLRQRDTGLRQE